MTSTYDVKGKWIHAPAVPKNQKVKNGAGWGDGRVGIQLGIQAEFQAAFRLGGIAKSCVCKMFGVWGFIVQAHFAPRKLTP